IVDWAYQEEPNSVVWMVRSDGTLLGLTYLREHDVVAWHRHDTDGLVESVAVIPEGNEDALYMIVKRTIDGATVRYLERMNSRYFEEIEDLVHLDCAITYDGRSETIFAGITMTLSGGTNWDENETLTLTASASHFK